MKRRDFIKQMGSYPLAARELATAMFAVGETALAADTPAARVQGERQTLDLSGSWQFRMDSANRGLDGKWFQSGPSRAEAQAITVQVPSIWQQYVDEVGGIAWYWKSFVLPKELSGRALRLRFGAVDYHARVWLNDQELGVHEGGFTPFEWDVRNAAHVGENRLVVRVVDSGRDFRRMYCGLPGWDHPTWEAVDGIYFDEIPAGFQDWREGFNHSGIWQPVELTAHDQVYVSDAFVLPRIKSGEIEARLEIVNSTDKPSDVRVTVDVRPHKLSGETAGSSEHSLRANPGSNAVTIVVPLREPHFWSPSDPFLYDAEVSIYEAQRRRDNLPVRFGFRELIVGEDGYFHLNGKRIFLKGAHYQSTEPHTLAFPENREMARRIVEVAKEGGFNFMRYQGRPTAPEILDAADELGIMVQSEPAIGGLHDFARLGELCERETHDLVLRDRNRPCILIWNMNNEQAAGMKFVQNMVRTARGLDPTRLITESAGGPSHFYLPYSEQGIPYLTEHSYQNAPVSEGVLEYWRKRGIEGQLYFVTEFGYGALEDIDAVLEKYGPNPNTKMEDYRGFVQQKREVENAFLRTNAHEIFPALSDLSEAAQTVQAHAHKLTVESFRSNPRLGGCNVVQLFDSNANEVDGLVDFWRNKRKKSFYVFQELNQPRQLIVQFSPLNAKAGAKVQLDVTLVNEDGMAGSKTLTLRVAGPRGNELFSNTANVEAQPWSVRLFSGQVPVGEESGKVTLEAELREGSRVLLKKSEQLSVYRDFRWPAGGFAVFDPQNQWPHAKRPEKLQIREYNPESERPELVVVTQFTGLWRQREEFLKFVLLMDQVRRGSTVLFLGIPSDGPPPFHQRAMVSIFNFSCLSVGAVLGFTLSEDRGSDGWGRYSGPYAWAAGDSRSGCPVTRHPVFEGLPGPGLMDWEYGNVVCGEVAVPFRMSAEDTGPDLPMFPLDNGKVAFCTYELLDQFERDGLAERLFSNIVGYLHGQLPSELHARSDRQSVWLQYHQAQVEDCWNKFLSKSELS
jgi:beta-galactosidase